MAMAGPVTLHPLSGLPLVEPGDDLARILGDGLVGSAIAPQPNDILVIAQKVVSKAEGRYVDLAGVTPGARALDLAAQTGKDPRVVEVILGESEEVVRCRRELLVVAHKLGFVVANAAVDQSNIAHAHDNDRVLLLPEDPDA